MREKISDEEMSIIHGWMNDKADEICDGLTKSLKENGQFMAVNITAIAADVATRVFVRMTGWMLANAVVWDNISLENAMSTYDANSGTIRKMIHDHITMIVDEHEKEKSHPE